MFMNLIFKIIVLQNPANYCLIMTAPSLIVDHHFKLSAMRHIKFTSHVP